MILVLDPSRRSRTSSATSSSGSHGTIGLPWAWSIVALTVMVRLLLVPLAVKQIHSMQAMQAHMPEMKAIQQRYKHDKQKRNEELMKFYRDNQVNPAAPCLPLLVQFPVFIALYLVLRQFSKHPPAGRPVAGSAASSRTSPPTRTRTGRATCCSRSTSAASSPRRTSCPRRWTRRSGR